MASDLKQSSAHLQFADAGSLIVVDGSLASLDQLLQALEGQGQVLVLDPSTDPIGQILQAAAAQGPLDAIHLLSHGSSGSIRIAGQSYGPQDLASLGSALAPGGDLLLYGCDVAASQSGLDFVQELARLTRVDVAASSDRTGASGNWTLELSVGTIEAQPLAAPEWQGDLAISITGTKVNEGSPFAPFTVTGLSAGQIAILGVSDKTTAGMVNAGIKVSLDNGATWVDYAGSITLPSNFTSTSKLLVAVSDSPETNGSITIEGIERYQLVLNLLPTSTSFQVETPNFLLAGESERYTTTQLAGSKSVFGFGGSWAEMDSFTRTLVLGSQTIGKITFPRPTDYNIYGGANGSKFVTASDEAPVTISLSVPQNYFGFWWSAGDDENILEFYKGDQLIETFKAELMNEKFPEAQFGNPYAKDEDGLKSSTLLPQDQQANQGEKYAFLNFFMKAGQTFDKVVMRGSNFEFDNLTFLKTASTGTVGEGTIIDDGSGVYLKLDASGNPIVDANGSFVNDPTAFVDNDYDNTPSLNDCAYVAPINLLANDVASTSSATLDPASIKLYSSLTSSGTGEGGSSLTTAMGEFKLTPSGLLFFNPNASFNGATDKISIYYTVKDSAGSESVRTAISLDAAAVTAPMASNGGAVIPWRQTDANASELFNYDADGNKVTATRTATGTGVATATSLTVNLQTNSDNDVGGDKVMAPVQAKLKIDTTPVTTSSGNNLAMGLQIPDSLNYGDFVDLAGVTNSVTAADLRSNPYDDGKSTIKTWVGNLGADASQTDPTKDYYTSQQVDIQQHWTDFDPMVNSWVKFQTGSLTPLLNKATATAWQIGTITLSFQNPNGGGLGVDNPLIHLANLGGGDFGNSAGTRFGNVGAQLQLASAIDSSGNAITGTTLSKLSGDANMTVTGNTIGHPKGATSNGTVKINGTGVASITFNVLMKGYSETDGKTVDDTTYPGNFNGYNNPDLFYLSTSAFIGPDSLGPTTTGAGADALKATKVCGVNNVVVNEGSPYAIFEVGGFEGSLINGLSLSSGTGSYGVDTGTALEYYDPSANNGQGQWIPYAGGAITIPENGDGSEYMPTKLLVRVAITNDAPADNGEQLTLSVTYPSKTDTGTLTIKDDGTGSVFSADNTSGSPEPVDTRFPHTALNDDVPDSTPLTINNLVVNEGSPYAIFTVTGKEGQTLSLGSLTSGTGSSGVDTGVAGDTSTTPLEYWNGKDWVTNNPGQAIRLGLGSDNLLDPATSASLLVRVAVKPDLLNEISEQLSLTATNTGGVASTGTLDIVDRSNGSLFGPSNTTGTPDPVGSPGVPEWLDDDTPDSRPVAINSVTVNEASPFAVFTVTAAAGQRVVLGQPSSGSAAVGTDTGTGLEYYNPATSQWTAYIPGSQVETPTSGSFLVRVTLVQDAPFEAPETFTITASNVNGDAATGTGTIVDDGSGTLFATRADKPGTTAINEAVTGVNPDGTPVLDTSTVKDDDRPIAVNNVAVNEASPYIVFTVSGGAGQAVKLSTANITATLGSDTSPAMQVYNGSAWVDYIRGSEVPIGANGQLLVRLAVTPDAQSEGTEKFNLIATTLSNKTAKGVGSISDDGTGSLFAATNTTGTPDPLGSPALPNTLTALDQDGAPPQTCWDLGTTEVTQGLNLAFNEYVDPSSIDLDPAAAGQQFSRDIFDSTNVKLGSYVARADGTITFEAAPAFRGTGVGPIDITLSVKAYKLDSNNQILLDESGDPVPDDTVALRIEQHKVGLGASSNSYVPTGATYTGPGYVLHGGYQQGTAWAKEAMYLTRAMIDSWIDPSDQTDPKFGINRNVLLEAPAPIKFYDPVSGVDRSAATLQKIKDAFLPAYQAIEPSLDSVAWVEGSYNGKPFWDLIWYDSKNPLKPLTNWTSTTDAAASVGRGFWLVSQPESTLSEPKTSGAWSRGDFWGNSLSTLTNVSVLRDVHTFGVALTEVCGVNNVTVNEGSPYAIFEVGGFEGGTISALTLASGTGTLGVDTGSGLEYFDGRDWVAYSGQPVTIPSDGDNDPYEPTKLLVRVAISNDDPLETVNGVGETLTLKANYGFGAEKTGTLTILDNGSGPVFGEANTTGTPDNPATSSDPSVPDFLDDDFRPTAPETCWSVTSVNIADKIKLGNFEAIDFSSVDLDIFTDGRQTSLTVQLNGADVGTYSVNSQGQVVFSGTSAFRGQAPEVFYSVDVVNKNTGGFIRKELAGFQVGADDVKTLYETKQINAVLFDYNFFSPGKDSYLVGAADNKGKQYPSTIGKTFKVWDHSSGSTITAELASEIAALYLPIAQSVYPSVDKLVVATEEIMSGNYTVLMYGYNSTNLLDSKINVANAPEFDLWWWDSDVPPGMGDITNSSYVRENFNIPSVYAANVPIQGLPVTEVCGVSSVVVNEGSPWAIFQVGGFETGTISSLAFTGATGTVGVDTGAQVQYYDPNFDNGVNQPKGKWIDYNGGPITVPDDGDRTYIEPTKLLVRVAINQDAPYEVKEELKLTATYAFGPVKTGTLTILDDGTGSVFGTANTSGTPDGIGTSTDPSLPTRLDDDRPLAVSNDWVYESAGFASFTVSGAPGQPVTLGLAAGTATDGSDYTNAMQVWNGSAWVAYAPGAVLGSDGVLKVRVAVNTDASTETPETFILSASNTSGLVAVGTATILDGTNPVPYGPSTDNVSQCWLPVTINVLANDVDANGQLVASSVLLSDTPNGVGSTQLNTAYGIYVVNADGTVTFTPVAKLPNGDFFNGVTSAIYYTVMNSAGVRSESSAIHIGDGILSDPVPVQGGTKSNLVQNGMWSIADVTTENRIPAAAGGTNLIINGDFSETGGKVSGLNSKSFAKVYSLISGTSSSKSYAYAALPGWSAKGGGLDTYAAWGNTSGVGSINPAWAGALEPTGANTNQVYFGNNNMWYYTGLAPAFNADGVGLADSANPVKFASLLPTYGNNATPVTISQTVTGLTNGERYRLQFWVTSESGYLGGKYPAPSVAAVDIGGYERTFFEVSTNQLNSSKLGTRYTIDFIAKSASTDISFMSWGHVAIAAAPKTYNVGATELILDDVILTLMPPQNQVSQFGTDGVPIMVKTCGINDVIVNEASPWAVFTVNGAEGQKLKLDLLDGTGVEAVDTNALQYLDPADNTWKPYTPGLELTLPDDNDGTTEKAQILVRVGIVNDAPFEQSEQLKLQASFDNGLVETGTLTILDNGTGNVFLDGNKTATPSAATDTGYPSALNDDRGSGPQVNSIVVNEASPYAIFTLKGVAGAGVNLVLGTGGTSTTAELSGPEADIGQTLEFWNASTNSWVAYNAAAPNATFGSNGQLLVRVAVVNDEPLEVSEDFTLTATYNNKGTTTGITVGAASTGQGVIKDDGTGTIFAAAPADPLSGAAPVPGVDAFGNPQIDTATPPDFDGITVNNLVVNEGSRYAVFTVGSPIAGAKLTLALGDGQATVTAADYTPSLEVWNPTGNSGAGAWVPYTAGDVLAVASPETPFLVRVALGNQLAYEGAEPFKLTAALSEPINGYPAGAAKTGTATILDDGRGTIFTGAVTPATGTSPATPIAPAITTTPVADPAIQTIADDDRPLSVNDVTVNEGSPFAVFSVGAVESQYVKLELGATTNASGNATLGTDNDTALEYWDGDSWEPYTPGSFIKVPADGDATSDEPAKLLVRVPISQDQSFENAETFTLKATNTGGSTATGLGTIKDDGTGDYFAARADDPSTPANEAVSGVGTDGLPVANTTALKDDDRPLTVNNVTVNEASPTIVFTVTGKEGQLFTLGTASGTAVLGQDTGTQLQVLTEICGLQPLTLNVLANDVAATGKTLDPASVRLFSAASGGTGSTSLTINGQGSYAVNTDGTITFTPAAGLLEGTPLTKVFYSVRDSGGLESIRSTIDLNAGATSTDALTPPRGTSGRYVRVEQSGQYLALAEVQVFSGTTNLAQGKTATQSSTGFGGVASRAVDGNTSGNFNNNTVTHTATTGNEWWEVDLGSLQAIDQIAVWNRDSTMGRLTGSTVKILDDQRQVVGSFVLTGAASQTQAFAAPPLAGADGQPLDEKCSYQWVDYTPGTYLTLPVDDDTTSGETASMLVRLAVKQDPNFEVSESFTLKATNTGGTAATGIGTILDDGTGPIFASPTDDPNTPANEAANPDGSPVLDTTTPKDDDRPLTVTGSTVKEPATGGTGYLTFNVSGIEGQPVQLALQSGTATLGDDTGSGSGTEPLEVWDPGANNNQGAWVAYDPANPPVIPQVGASANGETGSLSVRIAVKGDAIAEPVESLTLVATNASGSQASAPGYILDSSSPTAAPVIPDAKPIAVIGQTVNEASPYLVYTVRGRQGEGITLDLSTTGTGGGHVDPELDISENCYLQPTTHSVLGNDVAASGNLVASSVKLFSAASGGSGSNSLTINGEGTYTVDNAGVVTFTPVADLLSTTTLTPIYYSVLDSGNRESNRSQINFNASATSAPTATTTAATTGRYVRVSLAGTGKILSLAEVQVLSNSTNVALNKTATQSSSFTQGAGEPSKAVDGNTSGLWANGSISHTQGGGGETDPWWQVDLGQNYAIDSIKIYNRIDSASLAERLDGATVTILDANNQVVSTYSIGTAPTTSTPHTKDFPALPATANDGITPLETCRSLEYFNGSTWVEYVPGATITIPGADTGTPGDLLVRARVVNDGTFEGPETLNLVATSTAGFRASGTGTIVDDGTGALFSGSNNTATPDAPGTNNLPSALNDDRGAVPGVNSVTVNEGSPFTVFTVTGVAGAGLTLSLSDGTAEPEDHGTTLEFFDLATAKWVAYNPANPNAQIQGDGRLLVRVALANDAPFEGPETFNLTAAYNGTGSPSTPVTTGASSTGTATIVDDGTGVSFLTRKDDPLTPADESNLGVMDGNNPQVDNLTPKDDDRGVTVADVTVNEGSPFIVFKLESFVGQKLQVSVGSDTATLGNITASGSTADASDSLEYFNGTAWVTYTPGSFIDVVPSGNAVSGDPATVLVRLAVKQDQPYEMAESFTLKASTATGKSDSAIGTIVDNGTGDLFSAANTSGTPENPGVNSLPASRDDDRPFNPAFINNLTINEGSEWAVFTITGVPTAQVTLALPDGTATGDATKDVDYQSAAGALQVFIGGQWVDYNPNASYPSSFGTANNGNPGNAVLDANGQLLVRVKLNNQVPLEGAESFSLSLKYTGTFDTSQTTLLPDPNNTFTGNAVIVDDGSGAIFAAGLDDPNTPGIENTGVGSDGKPVLVDPATAPVVDPSTSNAPRLADDDRPLTVNNVTVNEASPFIVLEVSGAAGQYIKLETASGTATLGNITAQGNSDDVSSNLEYFDGTAWVAYTPGSYVRIPLAAGQSEDAPQNLLVRLAINNDAPFENSESFNLIATNTGGGSATGTGTIVDNGTGDVFPAGDSDVQRLPSSNLLTIAPTSNPSGLNDDRGITINNLVVNEASPFAVFTVRATEGQPLLLELGSGSATVGTDTGLPLEVYDPVAKAWVAYDSANPPVVPSDGVAGVAADAPLLVRVAISADQLLDTGETFTLKASYTGGGATASGTGTIVDDGSGTIFAARADDPANPGDAAVIGVNSDGTPATLTPATSAVANPNDPTNPALLADDDRPLTVSDLMVNEGSPFAVFSVGAKGGQYVQLTLSPGTASAGDDYANALEYWDPAANSGVGAWSAYIPGTFVKTPGEAIEPATLLVRVAIKVDQFNDNFETFNLTATNTGGSSATGSGTILDDGNGTIFATNTVQPGVNPSGNVPLTLEPTGTSIADPADPITPALLADDDRPLEVNDLTVNEGSPFAVFSVTGKEGQYVQLELIGGTATPDSDEVSGDYSPALEVWDGTGWIGYNPGTFVKIPADPDTIAGEPAVLLVRVAITADTPLDGGETFGLKASNTAGGSDSGTATIVDDGTGTLFASRNDDPATPDVDENRRGVIPPSEDALAAPSEFTPATAVVANPSDPINPAVLADDDRPLAVNSLTVNEASPFAVFTVTGKEGQYAQLSLAAGSATAGSDYGTSLEFWDPMANNGQGAWTAYTPGSFVRIPSDGDATSNEAATLLVRLPIKADTPLDGGETFNLTATNTGGTSATGTGTIVDDGTGTLFATRADDPATSANEAVPGVIAANANSPAAPATTAATTTPVANPATQPLADDDRPLTVNNVTVNEGSPYAVFSVTGKEGQYTGLSLTAGTATSDADYGNSLEIWNGSAWVDYTPGTYVAIPSDGDGTSAETAVLLVRVPIKADTPLDGGETFNLIAANTGGSTASGTGTIVDDGSGTLFATRADDPTTPANEAVAGVIPATAETLGAPATITPASTPVAVPASQAIADDDRPLAVNNLTVNEGSPFAVFTVSGKEGQYAQLSLAPGSATADADYANSLEFWNGSEWVAYTPGQLVRIPSNGDATPNDAATLLVRIAIKQDTLNDYGETFTLTATNSGGSSAIGTATIIDDGTGSLYGLSNNSGTPDAPGSNGAPAVRDDDRPYNPAFVDKLLINEGSPWAVFTIKGLPTAQVTLALPANSAEGAATLGFDYQDGLQPGELQVYVGGQWVDYNPNAPFPSVLGTPVNPALTSNAVLDANGQLLVRVKLENQPALEGPEPFTLQVKQTGNLDSATSATLTTQPDPTSVFSGTAILVDNGSGALFGTTNNTGVPDAPRDPANPNADPSLPVLRDDDRPPLVNNVTVNEGSPFIVFTVQAYEGQKLHLSNASDTATAGLDYSEAMEYWSPTANSGQGAWLPYTASTVIDVPVVGSSNDGELQNVLVRLAIRQDSPYEMAESFTLKATTLTGQSATGTGTIVDNGKGTLFAASPSDPGVITDPQGRPVAVIDTVTFKDDDRPYNPAIINHLRMNEGSPWAVFTITGVPTAQITLTLPGPDGATAPPDSNNQATTTNAVTISTDQSGDSQLAAGISTGNTLTLGQRLSATVASVWAEIANSASQASFRTLLKDVFGAAAIDANQFETDAAALSQRLSQGDQLGLRFELETASEMESTQAAFAAIGDNGPSTIYVNGIWYDTASANQARLRLLEELGHSFDLQLNGKVDTQGDEGERFAALFSGASLSAAEQARIAAENDQMTLTIDGNPVAVEAAVNNATPGKNAQSGDYADGSTIGDIQLYIGGQWVNYDVTAPYPAAEIGKGDPTLSTTSNAVLDANGELLARVKLFNQSPPEGEELLPLSLRYTGSVASQVEPTLERLPATGAEHQFTGTAILVDDGTGSLFSAQNTTGIPDAPGTLADLPRALDNDYLGTINNIKVDEASPFAVFTITGQVGQLITLSLAAGTATLESDFVDSLELFDPTFNGGQGAWVPYTKGSFVAMPTDGVNPDTIESLLFVRIPVKADKPLDGGEIFTLTIANSGGSSATGTATIVDDGTGAGTIFATRVDDPSTPANEAVLGVTSATATTPLALVTLPPATAFVADPATQAIADDDRPLSVNDVVVNERSPYLQWSVGGKQGQYVQLTLGTTGTGSGFAIPGTDTGTTLQVFNGDQWVDYTPGTVVKVPGTDTSASGQLLVRVVVNNDDLFENRETLSLTATNTGGSSAAGLGTIVDDGTGTLFGSANTSGTPDVLGTSTDPSLPTALDDDRIITINNLELNENSPFAVFTVSGTASQPISLALSNGTALVGSDYGPSLETFDSLTGQWLPYTAQSNVNLDAAGRLLVRTTIKNDGVFENRETFFLTGQNSGGISARGTATIFDDGKGSLMNPDGSLNTKIYVDDDRPMPASISVPAMQQALCIEDLFASYGMPNILSRLTGGEISRDRIMHNLASIP